MPGLSDRPTGEYGVAQNKAGAGKYQIKESRPGRIWEILNQETGSVMGTAHSANDASLLLEKIIQRDREAGQRAQHEPSPFAPKGVTSGDRDASAEMI